MINNLATKNSSDIYKYISSISNSQQIPSTIYLNDLSALDDLERAELFNKYFHSVYVSSPFTLPLLDDLPTPDTSLTNINISSYDVFQVLCTLDPTKAPRIDSISPVVFRNCACSLTNPVHIFEPYVSENSIRVAYTYCYPSIQIW